MFVLKALTDKYAKGGKLYLCFIDFKKAFDTVWRKGILFKALINGISGPIYHVLKNMYEKVFLGAKSDNPNFFESFIGTKQGAVESPTMFNLFINDIPQLFNDSCDPAQLCDKPINCLMYADDLVLISKSKTGLQNCLDKLSDYTTKWHLKINTQKSKIMIVNKTGRLSKEKFELVGETLENVREYNYLGITFCCSGSFTIAKIALKDRGYKAMWKLRSIIDGEVGGCQMPLKLFEQTVVPILLYGAEIWTILSDNRLNCLLYTSPSPRD